MLTNYLILTLRNLQRTKGYSFINLAGLTLGLTCCFFLFLYVKDELSYDQFHARKDRICRVVFSTGDDGQPTNANGSFGPGPSMLNDFPEVERFTRVSKTWTDKVLVVYEKKRLLQEGFVFADSALFQIFSFPLVKGKPEHALNRPNTVVLSESMARKYFDADDPIGKTIQADFENSGQLVDLEVTAIMKDIPGNSHVKANIIASIYSRQLKLDNWFGFNPVYTYVLLNNSGQAAGLNVKLTDYSKKYMGPDAWYQVSLQPLVDIHLKSALRTEFEPNGSTGSVYVFSAIAAIVLVIACINFMMLATARSMRRSKEVGLRKTMGAQRRQLIAQFMGESFLYTLLATLFGVALVQFFLTPFNTFTGKNIQLTNQELIPLLIFAFCTALTTTLLSGSYPSFFLSSFRPALVLKNSFGSHGSLGGLRKTLVVVQFAISITLLIATFVVFQQMNYVRQAASIKKGNQIIALPLNREILNKYFTFKEEVKMMPGVLEASGESILPSKGTSSNCFKVANKDNYCGYTYLVDPDFLQTHDYEIIAGRDYDLNIASDTTGAFIINRVAAREMGFATPAEALNTTLELENIKGEVIGVVEDFHSWSLRDSVEGTILVGWKPRSYSYFSVKVNPENVSQVLAQLEIVWSKFSVYPFDYFFLDQSFAAMHKQDLKSGQTLSLFAGLAICISCLGMIGLVSYTTEQRTKEIGIRKALGASVTSIVALLTRDFVLLVLVAFAVAAPAGWKMMSIWLQAFAYHVPLSLDIVALGGLCALILALASVAFNSVKAASANPVNSLRNE